MQGVVTELDGVVTSYDGSAGKHYAKVKLQPGGQETGWIHVGESHIGNGWGILSGLQINDQVTVRFQGGDLESGRIVGRLHSDVDQAPACAAGELLLQHQDGRKIYFDQAGNLTISMTNGAEVKLLPSGQVNVAPAAGQYVYVGGDPAKGGAYDWLKTVTSDCTNYVKGRIG